MQRNESRNFIQAAKSIASATSSLLGANKSIKCIIDDDNSFELTSSSIKLLQAIHIEHPALSVIFDVCQGMHKYCGTGCSTMIFMTGSWLQSFESIFDQGIPAPIIHQLFDDALSCCLQEIRDSCISLTTIHLNDQSHVSDTSTTHKPNTTRIYSFDQNEAVRDDSRVPLENKSINFKPSNKIPKAQPAKTGFNKYSRHSMDDVNKANRNCKHDSDVQRIRALCKALSRGNEIVSKLLEKIFKLTRNQTSIRNIDEMKFTTNMILTQIVCDRPVFSSFVFQGVCFPVNAMEICFFKDLLKGKPAKICLLDFDENAHAAKLCGRLDNFNKISMQKSGQRELWASDGINRLLQLQVSCVIVKGGTPEFIEECLTQKIATIQALTRKQLQILSEATGNSIISSLDELDESDIGLPVNFSILQDFQESRISEKQRRGRTSLIVINLTSPNINPMTVILCGTTLNLAKLQEEAFRRGIYKLRNILNSGTALIGGGNVESRCINALRCYTDKSSWKENAMSLSSLVHCETEMYRCLVYDEVAKGFERYLMQLNKNSRSRDMESSVVLDDVLSKTEAWKRAMKLVKSISRIDMVITTGNHEKQTSSM